MLATEVEGADGRASKALLLVVNELVLFFFIVDKVDRARRLALKIRFLSEFSGRSCFLYSSTVNQPDSDLSARRMWKWQTAESTAQ